MFIYLRSLFLISAGPRQLIGSEKEKQTITFKFNLYQRHWSNVISVLSFLSCGFSAGQDVDSVQSFTHLGDFHPHVSYAHMGMEISFSPFQQYISLLRKTLMAV